MTVGFDRCVVVGTGLIGASLAGAGKAAGTLAHVVGVGRDRENLDVALAAGLVDAVTTDLDQAVSGADLVVVATPVVTSLELLRRLVPLAPSDAVICDVGSVKAPIVELAEDLGIGRRFVGCHPMAGREVTGARGADVQLFDQRVVVLCGSSEPARPEEVPRAFDRVRSLWEAIGARVVTMGAQHHDETVAFTSHLPQMLSWALARSVAQAGANDDVQLLIGSGFRDQVRIASSDAQMWAEIAVANAPALERALGISEAWLGALRRALATGDRAKLATIFEQARRAKEAVLP